MERERDGECGGGGASRHMHGCGMCRHGRVVMSTGDVRGMAARVHAFEWARISRADTDTDAETCKEHARERNAVIMCLPFSLALADCLAWCSV